MSRLLLVAFALLAYLGTIHAGVARAEEAPADTSFNSYVRSMSDSTASLSWTPAGKGGAPVQREPSSEKRRMASTR